MTYFDIKRIERVLKLDKTVFKEIRDDKDGVGQGLVVLWLSAIIGGIWGVILSQGMALIGILIILPIGWAVGTGIFFLLAKLFGGKSSFQGYLAVLGYAQAPRALGIIPFLGDLVGGIWVFVAAVIATREAHGISTGKAVAVILIPVVITLIILAILIAILGLAFMSMISSGTLSRPYPGYY
jgi:hypothetical protein